MGNDHRTIADDPCPRFFLDISTPELESARCQTDLNCAKRDRSAGDVSVPFLRIEFRLFSDFGQPFLTDAECSSHSLPHYTIRTNVSRTTRKFINFSDHPTSFSSFHKPSQCSTRWISHSGCHPSFCTHHKCILKYSSDYLIQRTFFEVFSRSRHSVSVVRPLESMQKCEGLRKNLSGVRVEMCFNRPLKGHWSEYNSIHTRFLQSKNYFSVSTLTAVFTFGGMFVGGFAVPYLTQVWVFIVHFLSEKKRMKSGKQ